MTYYHAAIEEEQINFGLRCEHFGVPNYGFEYGTVCPMSSTAQNMVDLDLSMEAPRRAASPNSTISGSEVGSVSFATDEQLCNLSVVEPDNISSETIAPHTAIFLNHVSITYLL